jgi:N-formylglutamate deformylase
MSSLIRFLPGSAPLVLDSPHSGVAYPADFGHSCELAILRQAEDTHVEKLYDFAPALGVAWIEALFPRSYMDVNRNTSEIDVGMIEGEWADAVETSPASLAKVRLGKGLIWRMTDEGRRSTAASSRRPRSASASSAAGARTTRPCRARSPTRASGMATAST